MASPKNCRHASLFVISLFALLSALWLAYSPGLSSNFLFDDILNLQALGRFGGIDNLHAAAAFVFGGEAGPGGRPIALATFLLNDIDWPSNAVPFKYTNILIHALNTVGVAWLALLLALALKRSHAERIFIALLTAAMWGLHPYFVSSVLYVIQRMTLLSATFIIFGLVLYTKGRLNIAEGKQKAGLSEMTVGIALFTPLAFLSKENGGLLPALAGILAVTVLHDTPVPTAAAGLYRIWNRLFIGLPVCLMGLYFAYDWPNILHSYAVRRSFSLTERLLTESRIVLDYLGHLIIPRIQTSGLYFDDITLSKSLTEPATTLPAIVAVLGLATAGVLLRRRSPVLAVGILFFFTGHIIESSFIPLELYFEHRNYLPAVLLFFSIAYGTTALSKYRPVLTCGFVAVIVLALWSMTYARADLWGHPVRQGLVWARENPASIRAQQQAALVLWNIRRPDLATEHVRTGLKHNPDSKTLILQLAITHCGSNTVKEMDLSRIDGSLKSGGFSGYVINNMERLAASAIGKQCDDLTPDNVLRWVGAAFENPAVQRNRVFQQRLYYLKGELLIKSERPEEAYSALMKGLLARPSTDTALQMTALLASNSYYRDALKMLDNAETMTEKPDFSLGKGLGRVIKNRTVDYGAEIKRLRRTIKAHIQKDRNG